MALMLVDCHLGSGSFSCRILLSCLKSAQGMNSCSVSANTLQLLQLPFVCPDCHCDEAAGVRALLVQSWCKVVAICLEVLSGTSGRERSYLQF